MERFKDLDGVLKMSWNLMFRATVQRHEPFRTPAIATVDGKTPHLRTVVLREVEVDERRLCFFTDFRSRKVSELAAHPLVTWLFWDARRKLQIRLQSHASFHRLDPTARHYWDKLPVAGRRSYATQQAPGQTAEFDTDGLPDFWRDDLPTADTEFAYENFLVVACRAVACEVLHLHAEGHQRAAFSWEENEWQGRWLVP